MITHDLRVIADAILDKKGQNVVSLDLRPIGPFHDGVNLRVVLLHVFLRELEETSLCLLHHHLNIVALIKRLCFDDAGEGDELSGEELLRQDACMILHMGR